ncbi:exported hypothetical protein [Candidatus Microthrix parvicella RN1]|uniref:Uncharacterized protein n=1 Tax=Candidatus Neomicrothrix parvicella RN1 TaxID=1229780 RepID=R4YZP9_9ACTN|nr:exported hypothetical protein [Candidatus Microthrix parvicella RN1]
MARQIGALNLLSVGTHTGTALQGSLSAATRPMGAIGVRAPSLSVPWNPPPPAPATPTERPPLRVNAAIDPSVRRA